MVVCVGKGRNGTVDLCVGEDGVNSRLQDPNAGHGGGTSRA